MADQKPGLDHQFEMARNARLRLPKNVGQIGDRKFASGQQCQEAQTRIFARCP
jgi:hypothetical protein